jgi:hypothetical protein
MAEFCEPAGRAPAGREEEDDEEREPLLSRVAWAGPRKGAPGSAVRQLEDAGAVDAAASPQAGGEEPLPPPRDASGFLSRDPGASWSSPADMDRNHPSTSGAPGLPSPRARVSQRLLLPRSAPARRSRCPARRSALQLNLNLPRRERLSLPWAAPARPLPHRSPAVGCFPKASGCH